MKGHTEIKLSDAEKTIFSDLNILLTKQPGLLLDSKELVKKTGMNRTKLSTGFHFLYGLSIKQFQLQQRILHAKRKLVTTNLPIKAIAQQCGFATEKYFFAYFKQKTGLSPGNYRKRYYRV
jgi:AraC-like DNA-binding protein